MSIETKPQTTGGIVKIIYKDDKHRMIIAKYGILYRLSYKNRVIRESFDITEIKNRANELINKENDKK